VNKQTLGYTNLKSRLNAFQTNPLKMIRTYAIIKGLLPIRSAFKMDSPILDCIDLTDWTMDKVDSPTIDVILFHKNYGRFLKECLDSIYQQNVDSNIMLIDGGSTDNTFEVLKEYRHVKVFRLNNKGDIRISILFGIKQASSNNVIFFATDNVMLPNFLGSAMESLNSGKILAYGDRIFIDDQSNFLCEDDKRPYSYKNLKQGNYIDFSSIVFNTKAIKKVVMFEDIHYSLDWLFLLQLGENEDLVQYLGFPVIKYRLHSKQLSSGVKEVLEREVLLIRRWC